MGGPGVSRQQGGRDFIGKGEADGGERRTRRGHPRRCDRRDVVGPLVAQGGPCGQRGPRRVAGLDRFAREPVRSAPLVALGTAAVGVSAMLAACALEFDRFDPRDAGREAVALEPEATPGSRDANGASERGALPDDDAATTADSTPEATAEATADAATDAGAD